MSSENERPINVALFGMDERTTDTIKDYLAGPCEGLAIVATDENEADVDIIDADYTKAKDVLDERKENSPDRPIILLSLEELFLEGTIFVQKPIQEDDFISVLEEIHQKLFKQPNEAEFTSTNEVNQEELSMRGLESPSSDEQQSNDAIYDQVEEFISLFSKNKISEEIELKNKRIIEKQKADKLEGLQRKFYNPKNYFLGYLKSSFKVVEKKGVILELNSEWKPLFLFPDTREVWIDVEEKELKKFSRKTIENNPDKKMALKAVTNRILQFNKKPENFYAMDAFIWKIAIWTSKGQYPISINIEKPLYLKYWPNFTQLIVTPHALRIAALLVTSPRSAINIAESLKIKPEYVFVFISATNAIGLLGQAQRQVDEIVAPPKLKISKSEDYISRILSKLGS